MTSLTTDVIKNKIPHARPIQCNIPRPRLTTAPESWRLGNIPGGIWSAREHESKTECLVTTSDNSMEEPNDHMKTSANLFIQAVGRLQRTSLPHQ